MPMLIYEPCPATPTQFVEFWSSRYQYPDEQLYDNNVGRELTEQRITELFRWKNGMQLAGKKQVALRRFVERLDELKQCQPNGNSGRQNGYEPAFSGPFLAATRAARSDSTVIASNPPNGAMAAAAAADRGISLEIVELLTDWLMGLRNMGLATGISGGLGSSADNKMSIPISDVPESKANCVALRNT